MIGLIDSSQRSRTTRPNLRCQRGERGTLIAHPRPRTFSSAWRDRRTAALLLSQLLGACPIRFGGCRLALSSFAPLTLADHLFAVTVLIRSGKLMSAILQG